MSYAEALTKARRDECIKAAERKRRLCFAGSVVRIGDDRLLATTLLGELEGGMRYVGRQGLGWLKRTQEDFTEVGIATNTRREASAKKAEEWCDRIDMGVPWFVAEWNKGQKDGGKTRRLERERGGVEGQATANGGRADGDGKREK